LDLDAPIGEYLDGFEPENPFDDRPVTLRQLMAHRSGMVREPPVGHYLDPSEPDLAAIVASYADTALVYPPETRTKYTNGGIATVGRVVEAVVGEPFAQYVRRTLLGPLGMETADFDRD